MVLEGSHWVAGNGGSGGLLLLYWHHLVGSPQVKHNNTAIPISANMNDLLLLGASVLPVAVSPQCGTLYFLLGRETDWATGRPAWCDFGGSTDGDEGAAACASRELREESMGLVEASAESLESISVARMQFIGQRRLQATEYVTFLHQIPFTPGLPNRFVQQRLNSACSAAELEKSTVQFFSAERLQAAVNGEPGSIRLRRNFVHRARVALMYLHGEEPNSSGYKHKAPPSTATTPTPTLSAEPICFAAARTLSRFGN